MAKNIRTGEFRVSVEKEEPLWCDRKRIVFFRMPLSFTKYTLTPSKLLVESGFFNKREEETRLYRITDVSMTRSFFERIFGVGTLHLLSSDTSTPKVDLLHIRSPKKVKDVLSQAIENSRRENGVRTSEMVMGGAAPHHPHDGHPHDGHPHDGMPDDVHAAMGPDIIPDVNQNGIDDRME